MVNFSGNARELSSLTYFPAGTQFPLENDVNGNGKCVTCDLSFVNIEALLSQNHFVYTSNVVGYLTIINSISQSTTCLLI